jgi:antitoxin MazE
MRVSKWGDSLAVRLPEALVEKMGLRAGDELTIVDVAERTLVVQKQDRRKAALERLASLNWTLPPDYKFDRDEANGWWRLFDTNLRRSSTVFAPKPRAPRNYFLLQLQADSPCPDPSEKIFLWRRRANQWFLFARLTRQEGRVAIVTKRGLRCGGRGSVVARGDGRAGFWPVSDRAACGRTAQRRTAKPCGPGTRCWCQVGGGLVGPTGFDTTANSPTTVTRRIRRRGEHDISRKTIAQGMPDASASPVCSCAFFCTMCTRDRGCSAHPAFPAPSYYLGREG